MNIILVLWVICVIVGFAMAVVHALGENIFEGLSSTKIGCILVKVFFQILIAPVTIVNNTVWSIFEKTRKEINP